MANVVITKSNNLDRWNSLYTMWLKEFQPGYLTASGVTYQVVQNAVSGEWEFRQVDDRNLYESRSF